jgi:hypothetical protein
MAKSARFSITAPALPGCEFASRDALVGNVRDALAVQALLDDLNRTGDADAFASAITYMPLGGGGDSNTGKQVGAALAVIALTIAAPHIVATLGAGTALATAAGTLTTVGRVAAAGLVIGKPYFIQRKR